MYRRILLAVIALTATIASHAQTFISEVCRDIQNDERITCTWQSTEPGNVPYIRECKFTTHSKAARKQFAKLMETAVRHERQSKRAMHAVMHRAGCEDVGSHELEYITYLGDTILKMTHDENYAIAIQKTFCIAVAWEKKGRSTEGRIYEIYGLNMNTFTGEYERMEQTVAKCGWKHTRAFLDDIFGTISRYKKVTMHFPHIQHEATADSIRAAFDRVPSEWTDNYIFQKATTSGGTSIDVLKKQP